MEIIRKFELPPDDAPIFVVANSFVHARRWFNGATMGGMQRRLRWIDAMGDGRELRGYFCVWYAILDEPSEKVRFQMNIVKSMWGQLAPWCPP